MFFFFFRVFLLAFFPQTDFLNCVRICQEVVLVPSGPSSSGVCVLLTSVHKWLLHYSGEGVVERVVQNQKLSSKLFIPIVLKHTKVLLEVLKIKFNGCVVVF